MKKLLLVSLSTASIISLVTIILFAAWSKPVDPHDTSSVMFVINPGEGTSTIGRHLEEQGLIHNRYVFMVIVKQLGIEKGIQAGNFRVSKSQDVQSIAQSFTTGTLDVWVKIIEGWRSEEIAVELQKDLPIYDASWLLQLKQHEGYLFPDTYLIPKKAAIDTVVTLLTNTFTTKTSNLKKQSKIGLSFTDTIILASIIEREAQKAEDRLLVASVLGNRLKAGMPLQADATVQYALGYDTIGRTWWKKNLTKTDLAVFSPFNTYNNTGLPPHPIANPGLASIQAALNPATTDYIYYLTDKNGVNHYAKTLEEHNANIQKYL